jgi:hypothetical protein
MLDYRKIRDRRNGTGTSFSPSYSVFPANHHSIILICHCLMRRVIAQPKQHIIKLVRDFISHLALGWSLTKDSLVLATSAWNCPIMPIAEVKNVWSFATTVSALQSLSGYALNHKSCLPYSAKAATLHRPLASDQALSSDVHAFLHHAVRFLWQDEWTNTQGNKLQVVKPSVQVWHSSFSFIRKEEFMLTRLWIVTLA